MPHILKTIFVMVIGQCVFTIRDGIKIYNSKPKEKIYRIFTFKENQK